MLSKPDLSYGFCVQSLRMYIGFYYTGALTVLVGTFNPFLFPSSNFDPESFNLLWFFNGTCVSPTDFKNPTINNMVSNWKIPNSNSEEDRHRIFHFSVFMSLLLVGILELLFGLSQILIGFLGCLCGVSQRRSQIV